MLLLWHVQIRLVHDQGHAQHLLIELNRGVAVGANERDMMHALRLNDAHTGPSILSLKGLPWGVWAGDVTQSYYILKNRCRTWSITFGSPLVSPPGKRWKAVSAKSEG